MSTSKDRNASLRNTGRSIMNTPRLLSGENEYLSPPTDTRNNDAVNHSARSNYNESETKLDANDIRPTRQSDGSKLNSSGFSFVPAEYVEYRNVQATSRGMRRAHNDKEALEKARLAHRTGGYHKFVPFSEGESLTSMAKGAPGYCAESDRFDTDTAEAERVHRNNKHKQVQDGIETRRLRAAEREEERWKSMDNKLRLEQERLVYLRDFTDKGKPNLASVPYNPITLKYNDSKDGMMLKYEDDKIRYRAALRSHNLSTRMNAEGFNPITGEKLVAKKLPAKPERLDKDSSAIGVFKNDGTFNRSTVAGKDFIHYDNKAPMEAGILET